MNNKAQNNLQKIRSDAQYSNGRRSLLIVMIFSVINLFAIPFAERYFLFSAYLSQLFAEIGAISYWETGEIYYVAVGTLLGIISLLPYLMCYIFSKKHPGWMLGATIVFGLETILVAFDAISFLAEGETMMIFDIVFHIYALITLIQGTKYGFIKKKLDGNEPVETSCENVEAQTGQAELVRNLRVIRQKGFVGSAMNLTILVNGEPVAQIGNNSTTDIRIPEASVPFTVMTPDGGTVNTVTVPEGLSDVSYTVSLKTGFSSARIIIEPTNTAL